MILLGIILIFLQFFDIITTNIGIKEGCEEVNPMLKKSLKSGFPTYLAIIKISLAILLTFCLTFSIMILNWIFLGLDLFLLFVVVNNTIGIQIQKKWNVRCYIENECINRFTQFLDAQNWIASIKSQEIKY